MATTKKDIELQIHLSADTKQAKAQLDELYKNAQNQGVFKSKVGKQRSEVTKGAYNTLNNLAGQDVLSEDQAKQYSRAFNLVLQNLTAMYKASGKINGDLLDLTDKQTRLQAQLNKIETQAREFKGSNLAMDSETGELSPTKTKMKDFTKSLNVHKIKNDGTAYNQTLSDYSKIDPKARYMMGNKEVMGKDVLSKIDQYGNNLVKEYNDLGKEADNLKEKLRSLAEQVQTTQSKQATSDIDKSMQQISQVTASGNTSLNKDLNTAYDDKSQQNESSKTLKEASKQKTLLGRAFQQYTLYNVLIRSIRTAVNGAIRTITSLDKSLTEQAMVTGKTRQQTYKLLTTYQDLASQLGSTSSEVASVVTKYMQQGKTTEESITLATAAISAAKVAGIDASQSINYLTTALNGFQLSSTEAMDVSDKFAAIAANAATSYEEIATALSKVASQANLAGMSIDYTTALLAKGLETTREAPETVGTALKTIIARMRELDDYGETLSDGVDVNNVETQLSYIGIALRTSTGELRSTEDVLNELGLAWDNLSSNQQAAVAKALAGTRQQSRLIAMMSDYDRTLELQNISLQSSGATAAQSEKYLQGMEAAINKVKVAWESFTSSMVNSDFLIGLVNGFGEVLSLVTDLLSKWYILVPLLGTGVAILAQQLAIKVSQQMAAQQNIDLEAKITEQNQLQKDIKDKQKEADEALAKEKEAQAKLEQKRTAEQVAAENVRSAQEIVNKKKEEKAELEKLQAIEQAKKEQEMADAKEQRREAKQQIEELRKQMRSASKSHKKGLQDQLSKAQSQYDLSNNKISSLKGQKDTYADRISKVDGELQEAQKNLKTYTEEWQKTKDEVVEAEEEFGKAQAATKQANDAVSVAKETLTNFKNELSKSLGGIKNFGAVLKNMIPGVQKAKTALNALKGVAAALHVSLGAVIAPVAVLATILAGVAVAAVLVYYNSLEQFEKRMNDTVKSLNNAIYTNTNTISKLEDATDAWDDYNEELIHTKESADELTASLESVKDSLTEDQQSTYNSLTSSEDKVAYLKQIAADLQEEIDDDRQELLDQVYKYQRKAGKSVWDSGNTELVTNLSAGLKSNVNAAFNKALDSLDISTATSNSVLSSFQSLMGNISNQTVQALAEDSNQVEKIAQKMADTFVSTAEESSVAATAVLASDSYTLQEKIDAYNALANSISSVADKQVVDALAQEYQDIVALSKYSQETITYLSQSGNYIEMLNDVNKAFIKIGKSTEEASELTKQFYEYLANDQTIDQAVSNLGLTGTEALKVINAFDSAAGTTQLNLGQNLTAWENTISSVYETAAKWSSMTRAEQAEFMQENAELFSDANMLKAFQSGNYNQIYEALMDNDTIQEGFEKQLSDIEQQIEIEEARIAAQQQAIANQEEGWEDISVDTQYLDWLKEQYDDYYDNLDQLAQASLETRKSQQDSALSAYKEYLQAENDATEDALTKRKEAYQSYFDAINEAEEDQDYEEEANQIIANMSKVGVSADASSQKQLSEMEQSLADLEEERLDTLRERAQEAIVQDIDDQIDEMNTTLDELLDNERALLAAMTGQWSTEEGQQDFVASMLQSKVNEGATAMELADYISTLQSTYGYGLDSVNWDSITAGSENNTTVLNIGGEEITLAADQQQDLYNVIKNALRQIGVGGTTYGK